MQIRWEYDNRGILTAVVNIRGQWYRAKSEVLILNDNDEIFLAFKDANNYKIPGGGWDKNDIDEVDCVIRETLEEAHMKIKDIKYKTSYVERYEHSNGSWIGCYVKVFIARYDGKAKFHTDTVDVDKTIRKKGQWYKLKKVFDKLKAPHQEALR